MVCPVAHQHPAAQKRLDAAQIATDGFGRLINEALHPISAQPLVAQESGDIVVAEHEPLIERRMVVHRAVLAVPREISKGVVQPARTVHEEGLTEVTYARCNFGHAGLAPPEAGCT
ncbi:hypothetical protein DK389_24295 [Methylobacterium durans]|uniref:Uncharacterized protein n=1 Tax=Methylobacterium durans TaxID=2202825 RepID=A0A2U8WC59_9HYPH|nr:hypothetical protein DK389_24295 [Methylobacterium durans]